MASQFGLDFDTLVAMISVHPSVKIGESRDGGIGRRVGLRIQCPKGVQVQILFPAPLIFSVAENSETPAAKARQSPRRVLARLKSCPSQSCPPRNSALPNFCHD